MIKTKADYKMHGEFLFPKFDNSHWKILNSIKYMKTGSWSFINKIYENNQSLKKNSPFVLELDLVFFIITVPEF
jgi:hypothetical protein